MRLLQTQTLEISEFIDDDIPDYAILSHTWGNPKEEVSFRDLRKGRKQTTSGYKKIIDCCSLAVKRGFQWVWIDTCCIDKKSSAELSEAINSMYRWYSMAQECYVYLSDVRHLEEEAHLFGDFQHSRWFKHGWTLQELLAPSEVLFYDQEWQCIGNKRSLRDRIDEITGIETFYLEDSSYIKSASIAMKMSWASKRQTSRPEDMAYCLLGLFDINMSLLYGERSKAFLRLQHKIIKCNDDDSIFAWKSEVVNSSIFASSPSAFAESGFIYPRPWTET